MKKILIIACCLLSCSMALAQKTEGVVTYVRKEHWLKIINRLTFLSVEQKDRMMQTWKNEEEDNKGIKMKLSFNADESLYTYNSEEPEEGTYSWRKSEFYMYRNFAKERKFDILEMLGRTYVLDDSLHAPVWKIGNQIKEVAGYVCMKAETEDPVKKQKITAWFAQDIPVSAGPEQYNSLPGLILELDINDGDAVIEAVNIAFRALTPADLKLPKAKGKKINDATYNTLVETHIKESMEAHRDPYWALRY